MGVAGLWRRYLRKVGVVKRLATVQVQWCGWRFRVVDYLHTLLCGLILGLGRQCEVAGLRQDPGALLALGLRAAPAQASPVALFAPLHEAGGQAGAGGEPRAVAGAASGARVGDD